MAGKSKIQKKIKELRDIIFLCNCILNDADNQQDYDTANDQLFMAEAELTELLRKQSSSIRQGRR